MKGGQKPYQCTSNGFSVDPTDCRMLYDCKELWSAPGNFLSTVDECPPGAVWVQHPEIGYYFCGLISGVPDACGITFIAKIDSCHLLLYQLILKYTGHKGYPLNSKKQPLIYPAFFVWIDKRMSGYYTNIIPKVGSNNWSSSFKPIRISVESFPGCMDFNFSFIYFESKLNPFFFSHSIFYLHSLFLLPLFLFVNLLNKHHWVLHILSLNLNSIRRFLFLSFST